jgi:hypothetical protein
MEAVRKNYENTFVHIRFRCKPEFRNWWRCHPSGPTFVPTQQARSHRPEPEWALHPPSMNSSFFERPAMGSGTSRDIASPLPPSCQPSELLLRALEDGNRRVVFLPGDHVNASHR